MADLNQKQYVCYAASAEEISLLRQLLHYELIVRLTLDLKTESEDQVKVYRFMEEFEFYRHHDDVLKELHKALVQGGKKSETVVVLKQYADLHEFLLTITVEGGVPDYLTAQVAKMTPDLLERIKKAQAQMYSLEELNALKKPQKNPSLDGMGINVFGRKAIA